MKKINFSILSLFILFAVPSFAMGQNNNDPQKYNMEKDSVKMDYSETEMAHDRVKNELVRVSKNRWKNWVERSIYVLLLNALLLILGASLPKDNEPFIIVSYLLYGASSVASFWLFLCSILLFRLNAAYNAIIFLPLSFMLLAITYFLLMATKKSDISLSELKESFQKSNQNAEEDERLISITGRPGDWPKEDFIK